MTPITALHTLLLVGSLSRAGSDTQQIAPDSPGQQERLTETFTAWAAADGVDKLRFELKDVSIGYRPMLRQAYSRTHLKRFRLGPKQICPIIAGVCKSYEAGFELAFEVEVAGESLPSGAVQFNHLGQVTAYDGLFSEVTRLLSAQQARLRAAAACKSGGLAVPPEAKPRLVGKGAGMMLRQGRVTEYAAAPDSEGALHWVFPLEGKVPPPCFFAECSVDALSGAAKVEWRCGGLVRP